MSEVSDSIHLWRAKAAQVVELARTARTIGYVVASNEYWSTFVPLEDDESSVFMRRAPVVTLHWRYLADFSLDLAFSNGTQELGAVHIELPGLGLTIEPAKLFDELARATDEECFVGLGDRLRVVAGDSPVPSDIRDAVARELKLPAFEWLSPSYLRDISEEGLQNQFPAAELVE